MKLGPSVCRNPIFGVIVILGIMSVISVKINTFLCSQVFISYMCLFILNGPKSILTKVETKTKLTKLMTHKLLCGDVNIEFIAFKINNHI